MSKLDEIRLAAESDLKVFARLVNPKRVYGSIHDEVMDWWQSPSCPENTLLLLPRAHMKSHLAAVYAAWLIVKQPYITILYISATATLAEKQLYAIKNILDSKVVRRYWPDLIHPDEGKRERWTTTEICVDHPVRKEEGVRDATIIAAGLTGNIVGLHSDWNFLDDVVVPNNAYTEDGRQKVASAYAQLASIKNTGAKTTVVGTRYHPNDLYQSMLDATVERWEGGEIVETYPLYGVMERVVEEFGEFLWPKIKRADGRVFGFDMNELSKKKAEYSSDPTQFFCQYYNSPNMGGTGGIDRGRFVYYAKNKLEQMGGDWYYGDRKLNIYASIDFAFSLKKRADFTSIVVIGMDHERNVYVLDIERFKTNQISEYFKRILDIYLKWGLRRMRAEVTVAQQVIVNELKNRIKDEGIHLKIDDYRPPTNQGSKEDRINGILQPRYDTQSIFHYKGGWCQTLEEELVMEFPPHDDVKDSLASAIDGAMPPRSGSKKSHREDNVIFSSRFGGVAYA